MPFESAKDAGVDDQLLALQDAVGVRDVVSLLNLGNGNTEAESNAGQNVTSGDGITALPPSSAKS